MPLVDPRVETADEARTSIKSSVKRMLQDATDLNNWLSELLELEVSKVDDAASRTLVEIQEQVADLTDSLRDTTEGVRKGEQQYQQAQSILMLLLNLDDSLRAIEITLRAETAAVLINAEAREVIAAEPKTERPEGFWPQFLSWTADGMRNELGVEFQLRFPIFLGCHIKIRHMGKGFDIHLRPSPESPIEIKEVLKTLKQKTEEFLRKELLNSPFTFMYDVTTCGTDKRPLIICTIASPSDSHFR